MSVDLDLYERWNAFCGRIVRHPSPVTVRSVYDRLAESYDQPHRAYHNLDHIRHCLDELNLSRPLCTRPEQVEAAVWFHDVIYNPQDTSNEEESAKFAQESLCDLGTTDDAARAVASMIRMTKHDGEPSSVDESVLVDVDLSILGKPSDVFDDYESKIRSEYAWVEDRDFAVGRCQILEAFLRRSHIFTTEPFQRRYEAIARANLRKSIERLRSLIESQHE